MSTVGVDRAGKGYEKYVYVYTVPEDLLYRGYNMRPETCPFAMYSAEIVVPELTKRHARYYQQDPERAKLFVVPQFSSCFYHFCLMEKGASTEECKGRTQEYFEGILDWVDQNHSYWGRRGGSDHVFTFTWDQGSEILGFGSEIADRVSSSIHLVHHGNREVSYTQNYNRDKDIVIPPYRQTFEIDALIKKKALSKSILAYFRGTVHEDDVYGHGIRKVLRDLGASQPDKFFIREGASIFYWQEIAHAKFSLCPPGWSLWSPRLFDAIYAESVPVLFSRDWILPFEDCIDYDAFVVFTSKTSLERDLSDLSPASYSDRLRNLRKFKGNLRYNDEIRENDAIDLLLRKLFQKVHS